MTTIAINGNPIEGRKPVGIMRKTPKVSRAVVSIEEDDLDRIPGLPGTKEECIASLQRSMEEYGRTGATVSMEEMMAKHPRR
jgi:hypothetical protein